MRGRPSTCSQARAAYEEIPEQTPVENTGDEHRQEMAELRGMLTGLMQVVNTIATNQARQGSQEASGIGSAPPVVLVAPVAPVAPVVADPGTQLLKDFMAFQPLSSVVM